MRRERHRLRGFTVTELLVTIAILMVLVIAAGRAIVGTPAYQVAFSAGSETADLLAFARTMAMSSGNAVMVKIQGIGATDPDSHPGIYTYQMHSNQCGIPTTADTKLKGIDLFNFATGSMIYRVVFSDGTRISTGNLWLCYRPNGSLNFQTGTTIIPDGEMIFRYIGHNGRPAGPYIRVRLLPFGDPRVVKVQQ